MYPEIDYARLAEAVKFYKYLGYEMISVPWIVPNYITSITTNKHLTDFIIHRGTLVGSAEQSFLYIYDQLESSKKYMAVTPCFREEDVYDEIHFPYFMKLELFIKNENRSYHIMADALQFFSNYSSVEIASTEEGCDLLINDIEVGSYGYRTHEHLAWTYGTGIAEPRFTQAINI